MRFDLALKCNLDLALKFTLDLVLKFNLGLSLRFNLGRLGFPCPCLACVPRYFDFPYDGSRNTAVVPCLGTWMP